MKLKSKFSLWSSTIQFPFRFHQLFSINDPTKVYIEFEMLVFIVIVHYFFNPLQGMAGVENDPILPYSDSTVCVHILGIVPLCSLFGISDSHIVDLFLKRCTLWDRQSLMQPMLLVLQNSFEGIVFRRCWSVKVKKSMETNFLARKSNWTLFSGTKNWFSHWMIVRTICSTMTIL